MNRRIVSIPIAWLTALCGILVASALGHLIWEILQLPLYAIWLEGTTSEIAFAVVHCTGGDVLIVTSTLVAALLAFGRGWPTDRIAYRNVMFTSIALGVIYTIFSEWLNVNVRGAWAYGPWMPRIPPLDTGLTPLLQWIAVPTVVFLIVRRRGAFL
jgi:hypothetical protein